MYHAKWLDPMRRKKIVYTTNYICLTEDIFTRQLPCRFLTVAVFAVALEVSGNLRRDKKNFWISNNGRLCQYHSNRTEKLFFL